MPLGPATWIDAERGWNLVGLMAKASGNRCDPRDVQIRLLNVGRRSDTHRETHPPVIGGKNAISRAPAMTACGLTCAWSIAARITPGFSNA